MGFSKVFKVVSINCFILAIILLAAEVTARIFLFNESSFEQKRSQRIKQKAYLSNPADYELLNRSNCPRQKIITLNTDGASVRHQNPNWSCGGITSKDGKRFTVGQPASARNSIHVFGGSTVWGTGSVDRDTIPSNLQRLVNAYRPGDYKVINHGFTTLVAIQQYQKLQTIDLKRGDIVIFYDGGNDVTQRAIYGRPEGTVIGYNQSNKIGILFSDVRKYLSDNSKLYVAISRVKSRIFKEEQGLNVANDSCLPSHLDDAMAKGTSHEVWNSYFKNLALAKRYTENRNASFYHFLQPLAFNYSEVNGGDSAYYQLISEGNQCFMDKLSIAYEDLLSQYLARIQLVNGKSLSAVLMPEDPSLIPIHYFIDWIHVTGNANKIIGDSIWRQLQQASI